MRNKMTHEEQKERIRQRVHVRIDEQHYWRSYLSRICRILTAALLSALVAFVSVALFHLPLQILGDELHLFQQSSFQYGYVLKEPLHVADEYFYPDVGIIIYADPIAKVRLPVSVVMEMPDIKYTDASLIHHGSETPLKDDEIQVPYNIAAKYGLEISSVLYCELPYMNGLKEVKIVSIGDSMYPITYPSINSNLGTVLIGFDQVFIENIHVDCLVFSSQSLAREISANAAVLRSTISRTAQIRTLLKECIPIALIILMLLLANAWVYYHVLCRYSIVSLRVRRLKGLSNHKAYLLMLMELLVFFFIPIVMGTKLAFMMFMRTTLNFFLLFCGAEVLLSIAVISLIRMIKRIGEVAR